MDSIIKILKAIRKINPNSKMNIVGEDIDTCEITWLDGTTSISKEDTEAMIPIVEQEIKDAEANAIAKKESAKAKLAALGLDEEEIKAIIGV